MADLSVAIEYDRLYPIKIKTPYGDDTGIVINVVSKDSRRVVDALRKAQGDYWSAMATAGDDKPAMPDVERIVLIACIDSWDWGEHSFAHISGAGVASQADREFLIDHPNSKWIRDNIADGAANLENFSQPSRKNARIGSKKT